nr:Translation initiation factor IF-2 like [Ipomoea batatas]GMC89767.1 Translation initiation factor IF-2 like [Ipomoea batatas]
MPHLKVADALGVLTICLVSALFLFGLFCILYLIYFRNQIRTEGNIQLHYFSGPWIIRITYILFAILWGFGEILRLSLLRCGGRLLNALSWKWQETICKCHIVSNLGFMEPCLFLTVVFLLHASLQRSGTLNRKWNGKTACYILLFCLPVFFLQLIIILFGPKFNKDGYKHRLPDYFTSVAASPKTKGDNDDAIALCAYPLLSTICIGVFAVIVTSYLSWIGRRIVHLIINKGLQKRVYTLIISFSGFFPLRFVFLGLSVLSAPGEVVFEILAFLGFLSFLCCAGVGICTLVYFPVADALALRNLQKDTEARRISDDHNDSVSLITNQSHVGASIVNSPGRNSAASTRPGSISFRTVEKDGTSGTYVELSLFSPSQHSTPPDSPRFLGWPMLSHS